MVSPMPDATITTREEIEQQQLDRLPRLATRIMLHPRPKQALEAQTADDALELAAADVVESGREFAELSEDERMSIYVRSYEHCAQRNTAYLAHLDSVN